MTAPNIRPLPDFVTFVHLTGSVICTLDVEGHYRDPRNGWTPRLFDMSNLPPPPRHHLGDRLDG